MPYWNLEPICNSTAPPKQRGSSSGLTLRLHALDQGPSLNGKKGLQGFTRPNVPPFEQMAGIWRILKGSQVVPEEPSKCPTKDSETTTWVLPVYSPYQSIVQTSLESKPVYSPNQSRVHTSLWSIPVYSPYQSIVHTSLQSKPVYGPYQSRVQTMGL